METKTVLLVDLSAIFRAAWHANETGPTTVTMQATLDGVRRCQTMTGECLVAVCCDGKGNWRKTLSPAYKQHREKQPEAMYGCLDRVKDRLVADGYLLWTADGYEADDLLGGATAQVLAAGHDVVIASHDKDVCSLVSDHVRMLKTSTWEFLGPAEVTTKFGVEPDAVKDWLALVGDKSDGVEGVPGVGPKNAAALLIAHGDLDGIYRKVDKLQVFTSTKDGPCAPFVETMTEAAKAIATPAIVRNLWAHKETAMLARKLVELKTDAPIDFKAIYETRTIVTTTNSENTDLDAGDDFVTAADRPKKPAVPARGTESAGPKDAATVESTPVAAAAAASYPGPVTATDATALAPYVEVEYERALEPRTPGQALKMSEVLFESRAFSRFPTAGSIAATIMRGRELGISAMASLDAFHFVADLGRILPSWQVIVSLAEESPDCEFIRWIGGDDKSQSWETKHKKHDKPVTLTYRYDQAERAGLVKTDKPRSAWMARPDEMMRKTAACQLARAVYPGATLGLYSSAEMGGEE